MKIYLEFSALQRLKESKYSHHLTLFHEVKGHHPVFFSEAHLYDLIRSDREYHQGDLDFMESIMGSNCLHYIDEVKFDWKTPIELYEYYEWPATEEIDEADLDETMERMIRWVFEMIQKAKNEMKAEEELPEDMPESFKLLVRTSPDLDSFRTNYPAFINSMVTDDQEHKKLLQFLHKHVSSPTVMAELSIDGHDGVNMTDRDKFVRSFAAYYEGSGQNKTDYDLFTAMYHGLELMAFLKGSPSKQRAIPLVNDSRHAFFATRCDILVSHDKDFVRKTTLMYYLLNIEIPVVHLDNMIVELNNLKSASQKPLSAVFSDLDASEVIIHTIERNNVATSFKRLKHEYLGYFNVLAEVSSPEGNYSFLGKEQRNLISYVIPQEVAYVTYRLEEELGLDLHGRGLYAGNKLMEREWQFRNVRIIMNSGVGGLILYFYPGNYSVADNTNGQKRPKRIKIQRHYNRHCNRIFVK